MTESSRKEVTKQSTNRSVRRRSAGHHGLFWLLMLIITSLVGCALNPTYPTHLANMELPARHENVHRAGFLMPNIAVYKEPASKKLVYQGDWSRDVGKTVLSEWTKEMKSFGMPMIEISGDDPEAKEILDLMVAVEMAIQRHAMGRKEYDQNEIIVGKKQMTDYSVGPVRAFMERNKIDALWVVTGKNLIPTTGRTALQIAKNTITTILNLSYFFWEGGWYELDAPIRSELQIALIDDRGLVVYYGYANEYTYKSPESKKVEGGPVLGMTQGNLEPGLEPAGTIRNDLRDPETARLLVRSLAADYRKTVGK